MQNNAVCNPQSVHSLQANEHYYYHHHSTTTTTTTTVSTWLRRHALLPSPVHKPLSTSLVLFDLW